MNDRNISLAKLAMRLRVVTSCPPNQCVAFLEQLPDDLRLAYVEHMEASQNSLFVDPLEIDPMVCERLAALRQEADRLRDRGEFGTGMGSGGNAHAWVKDQMLSRFGISWRTPWEMNPHCAFD
jgi:hypothetical protein